jgi:hypothetical protein
VGISFNVAFNRPVPPYDKLGGDHMALGAAVDRLDKVASSRRLATLGQFVSIDPEEAAELTGLDPDELGLPPLEWFDPAAGLAAVRALAGLLRDDPKAVRDGAALLADLEEVERELAAAQRRRARFHFCLLD